MQYLHRYSRQTKTGLLWGCPTCLSTKHSSLKISGLNVAPDVKDAEQWHAGVLFKLFWHHSVTFKYSHCSKHQFSHIHVARWNTAGRLRLSSLKKEEYYFNWWHDLIGVKQLLGFRHLWFNTMSHLKFEVGANVLVIFFCTTQQKC